MNCHLEGASATEGSPQRICGDPSPRVTRFRMTNRMTALLETQTLECAPVAEVVRLLGTPKTPEFSRIRLQKCFTPCRSRSERRHPTSSTLLPIPCDMRQWTPYIPVARRKIRGCQASHYRLPRSVCVEPNGSRETGVILPAFGCHRGNPFLAS